MTFHLDGMAGESGDNYVYDGWSEAFDALAERVARSGR
jgi:hypothetical protein